MSYLNAPHLHDERAAYAFVEARVWAGGRVCPKCGVVIQLPDGRRDHPYRPLQVPRVPLALHREDGDHLRKLAREAAPVAAGDLPDRVEQEGHSSNQLHRTLGVTLKTAWFMSHRIREAMGRTGGGSWAAARWKSWKPTKPTMATSRKEPAAPKPLAARLSPRAARPPRSAPSSRWSSAAVRCARSTCPPATKEEVSKIVLGNVASETRLHTDESKLYTGAARRLRLTRRSSTPPANTCAAT